MILTDKNFKEGVFGSELPVLIEFWASWCPPCKMMEPVMVKLIDEYRNKLKIYKLNVDQNKIITDEYGINGVPTFILFCDGQEIDRRTGAQSEEMLKTMIAPYIDKT